MLSKKHSKTEFETKLSLEKSLALCENANKIIGY